MKYKLLAIPGALARMIGGIAYPPLGRWGDQTMNRSWPNVLLDPNSMTALKRRGDHEGYDYFNEMLGLGIDQDRAKALYRLSKRLIQVEELLNLRRKKIIEASEYKKKMDQLGVSEADGEKLYQLTELPLDPQIVIQAMWRKVAFRQGTESYEKELERSGFTPDRIEVLKEVSKFYPSAGDLITWQVKEVYEPDAIKKFGLAEELDLIKKEPFYKAGIDDEQIRNFWIAHWEHPSWLRVREMLHRTDLTEADVYEWFRLVEIPPYWRKKFTEIMYNPYTRVDVRRMHKLGVLDRDQVKRSYMDLGYDEEKAENLTKFTEAYNEDPPEEEKTEEDKRKEELRGLTRSTIIKRYKENWFDFSTAKTYLTDIGYKEEVVEILISMADYEKEEDRVDSYVTIFHKQYLNGIWDYNEIADWLGKLNLPASNIKHLVELWDIEKLSRTSQPSKAELIRFAKKTIIDMETFGEKMQDLGYSLKYIGWYIKDAGLKPA